MNKKELEAFAREAAKGMKTEKDLNEFSQMLTKVAVEAALNAELDDHLGFSKNETSDTDSSRNDLVGKYEFRCSSISAILWQYGFYATLYLYSLELLIEWRKLDVSELLLKSSTIQNSQLSYH